MSTKIATFFGVLTYGFLSLACFFLPVGLMLGASAANILVIGGVVVFISAIYIAAQA